MAISQFQLEEAKQIVCFVSLIHFKKFPPNTAQEMATTLGLTFNKKLLPAIRNICGKEVEATYLQFFNEEELMDKLYAEYIARKSKKAKDLFDSVTIAGLSPRDPKKLKKLPKKQVGVPGKKD